MVGRKNWAHHYTQFSGKLSAACSSLYSFSIDSWQSWPFFAGRHNFIHQLSVFARLILICSTLKFFLGVSYVYQTVLSRLSEVFCVRSIGCFNKKKVKFSLKKSLLPI